MRNYIYISIAFILLRNTAIVAQTPVDPYVINSNSGEGTIGNFHIFFNVGEPIIETGNSNNLYYTQGFLQPDYVGLSGALTINGILTNITCPGQTDGTVRLNITGGHGDIGIVWQNNKVDTVTFYKNLSAGEYVVSVYDTLPGGTVVPYAKNPIRFTITDASEPCPLEIYNAITPNQDGKNDFFYIGKIDTYPENQVFIFNRWGTLLWSTKNYDNIKNAWLGKDAKGDEVAEGTYYYIIVLNNKKSLKGWLEVTR